MNEVSRPDIPRQTEADDDFPARIAGMLESTATRVRALTVDRIAGYVLWGAVGLILTFLGLLIVVFLTIALFRVFESGIGDLLGNDTWGNILAYGVLGGLFVGGGAFLWSKRHPKSEPKGIATP